MSVSSMCSYELPRMLGQHSSDKTLYDCKILLRGHSSTTWTKFYPISIHSPSSEQILHPPTPFSTWTKYGHKPPLQVWINDDVQHDCKSSAQRYEIAGFFLQMSSTWTFKGPPPPPPFGRQAWTYCWPPSPLLVHAVVECWVQTRVVNKCKPNLWKPPTLK